MFSWNLFLEFQSIIYTVFKHLKWIKRPIISWTNLLIAILVNKKAVKHLSKSVCDSQHISHFKFGLWQRSCFEVKLNMWKASAGHQIIAPQDQEDDDWETDPDFVNDVTEQEQRWGSKTIEGSGRTAGAIE